MPAISDKHVVVTGCGWVTPFAAGTIEDVLVAGSSGARAPSDGLFWPMPDTVLEDHPHLAAEIKSDKCAAIAAIALEQAGQQAGLSPDELDPERAGLVLGCGLAGQLGMITFADEVRQQSARFVSPIHFPQTVGNYVSGALARAYHLRGPNLTLASDAASGLEAIREAARLVQTGKVDIIFVGGADAWTDVLAQGQAGNDRVLSEGACLFVLERKARADERGAASLAVIDVASSEGGPGTSSDMTSAIGADPPPGAICIEHWVGRCPGAAGVAAFAAAIGAVQGLEVPLVDRKQPDKIESGRPRLPTSDTCRATILAGPDESNANLLHVRIPLPG